MVFVGAGFSRESVKLFIHKEVKRRCAEESIYCFRISMDTDHLTQKVIGCAIEVHKQLGPGLLESSYESCLLYELEQSGLIVETQVSLPIHYKGLEIEAGYRLDLLIPGKLIIELKSVDKLLPVHSAQTLTYMKLSKIDAGLLINFNTTKLIDGVKRLNLSV